VGLISIPMGPFLCTSKRYVGDWGVGVVCRFEVIDTGFGFEVVHAVAVDGGMTKGNSRAVDDDGS